MQLQLVEDELLKKTPSQTKHNFPNLLSDETVGKHLRWRTVSFSVQ